MIKRFNLCLIAMMVALFAPATSQAPQPLQIMAATQLKINKAGHFYTRAEINGNVIDAMIDTGASVVALSYEDAEKAGLHPRSLVYDIPFATANGASKAALINLRKVSVDGVRVNDVQGAVMPKGATNITLIGMSFLNRLSSFKAENGVLYLKD